MSDDLVPFDLDEPTRNYFKDALEALRAWSNEHPIKMGVGKMAVGLALSAAGVKLGALTAGTDLFLTSGAMVGSTLGAPAGLALCLLGNIGVVGAGVALGIPAIVLATCGGALVSLAGYAVGDIIQKVVDPVTLADVLAPGSLVLLGAALMVDGARQVLGDARVAAGLAMVKDSVLYLARIAEEKILKTADEVASWLAENCSRPEMGVTTAGFIAASGIAGYGMAASTVTVLGSKTLGAVALSLGLVSAPAWPVVAAVAAATGVSYAIWLATRRSSSGR